MDVSIRFGGQVCTDDEVVMAVAERLAEIEYGHTVNFESFTKSERDSFVDNAKSVIAIVIEAEEEAAPMRMEIDKMVDEVCKTARISRQHLIYRRDREASAARAAAGFLCRHAIEPQPTLTYIARAVFGRNDSGTAHNRIAHRHVNPYSRVLVEWTCKRLNLPDSILEEYDSVPRKRSVATGKERGVGQGAVRGGGRADGDGLVRRTG